MSSGSVFTFFLPFPFFGSCAVRFLGAKASEMSGWGMAVVRAAALVWCKRRHACVPRSQQQQMGQNNAGSPGSRQMAPQKQVPPPSVKSKNPRVRPAK